MNATSRREAILLIDWTDSGNGSQVDGGIETRLKNTLGFQVTVQKVGPQGGPSIDIEKTSLIVIACENPPTKLRRAQIPVVVCHPSALPVLGMTGAREHTDFGADESVRHVQITEQSHVLSAAQAGTPEVLGPDSKLGWGRPFPTALRIAGPTPGSESGKTTVFAYAGGVPMCEYSAPAARVAVLLRSSPANGITADGWAFFDAAVRWSLSQGTYSPPLGATGTHTDPTHTLNRQEYRDWVQQQVSNRLWRWIVGIGVGGLLILAAGVNRWVDLVFVSREGDIVQKVQDGMVGQVKDTVATAILGEHGMYDHIKTNIEGQLDDYLKGEASAEAAGKLLSAALKDEESIKSIAVGVIAELTTSARFGALVAGDLAKRYEDAQHGQERQERLDTLRFLALLDPGNRKLHDFQWKIITGTGTRDAQLDALALSFYRLRLPGTDAGDDTAVLDAVLDTLIPQRPRIVKLRESCRIFLSRLDGTRAERLAEWIRAADDEDDQQLVLDGLVQIAAMEPIGELLDMARDYESERVSVLGYQGLAELPLEILRTRSEWEPERRKAIRTILKLVKDEEFAPAPLGGSPRSSVGLRRHVAFLHAAVQVHDIARIRLLRSEAAGFSNELLEGIYQLILADDRGLAVIRSIFDDAQEMLDYVRADKDLKPRLLPSDETRIQRQPRQVRALAHLLQATDWESLIVCEERPLWPKGVDDQQNPTRLEYLCWAWTEVLKNLEASKRQTLTDNLLDQILKNPDWFKWSRFRVPLEFAIAGASEETVGRFLESLGTKLQETEADPVGAQSCIGHALRRDASPDFESPYVHSTKFVKAASELSTKRVGLRAVVIGALKVSVTPPQVRVLGLVDVVSKCKMRLESDNTAAKQLALATLAFLADEAGKKQDEITRALENANAFLAVDKFVHTADTEQMRGDGTTVAERIRKRVDWIENLQAQTIVTPAMINDGQAIPIDARDNKYHWVQFDVDAGYSYSVRVDRGSADYKLVNAEQNELLDRAQLSDGQLHGLVGTRNGTQYLGLTQPRGETAELRLTLRRTIVMGTTRKTAPSVVIGVVYSGSFDEAPAFWVRFTADAGTKYVLKTHDLASDVDTVLRLYAGDADDYLRRDDDGGDESLASNIRWFCTTGGEYFVEVRNLRPPGRGTSFRFSVTPRQQVEMGDPVDVSSDRDSAQELSQQNKYVPVRFPADTNEGWLSLRADSGQLRTIFSTASVEVESTSGDPVVKLGDIVGCGGEPGGLLRFSQSWFAAVDGAYRVRVTREPEAREDAILFLVTQQPKVLSLMATTEGAPAIAKPPESSVAELKEGNWFASFDAEPYPAYQLTVLPLVPGLSVDVALLDVSADGAETEIGSWLADTDETAVRWECQRAARYYLRFRVGGSGGRVLLDCRPVSMLSRNLPYGGFRVGDRVILGKHEDLSPGGANWNSLMEVYAGKEATITELREKKDTSDSYVVRVYIDNERYVWRTRNMRPTLRTIGAESQDAGSETTRTGGPSAEVP